MNSRGIVWRLAVVLVSAGNASLTHAGDVVAPADPRMRIRELEKIIRHRPTQDEVSMVPGILLENTKVGAIVELLQLESALPNPRSLAKLMDDLAIPPPEARVDLDGDGRSEYLWTQSGYDADGLAAMAGDVGGRLSVVKVRGIWGAVIAQALPVKGSKHRAAVVLSRGGNGAGYSNFVVIEARDGGLRTTFQSPESSFEGIKFKGTGQGEVFEAYVSREIAYNRMYLPAVYRWSGTAMEDCTYRDPALMIDAFRGFVGSMPVYARMLEEMLSKGTPEEQAFWLKHIKPISPTSNLRSATGYGESLQSIREFTDVIGIVEGLVICLVGNELTGTDPESGSVRWRVPIPPRLPEVKKPHVLVCGKMLVVFDGGYDKAARKPLMVRGIQAVDGRTSWTTSLDGLRSVQTFITKTKLETPRIAAVQAVSEDGFEVIAIAPWTGATLFRQPGQKPLALCGSSFVVSGAPTLGARSIPDGRFLWMIRDFRGFEHGSRYTQDHLFVPDGESLVCFNALTGAIAWSVSAKGPCYAEILEANDSAVIMRCGGTLHWLDPGTGLIRWSRSGLTEHTVVVAGNTIVDVEQDGRTVTAVSRKGEEMWRVNLSGLPRVDRLMAGADRFAAVFLEATDILLLDGATGRPVFTLPRMNAALDATDVRDREFSTIRDLLMYRSGSRVSVFRMGVSGPM